MEDIDVRIMIMIFANSVMNNILISFKKHFKENKNAQNVIKNW